MSFIFDQSFKNKKVFITGHTGFKGSWLTVWLHLLGAKIKGYSLPPERSEDLYHSAGLEKLCESVFGTINDAEKLKKEITDFEPDFIFHLAAQPLVRLSYEKPVETISTNVIGTINLLEAVRSLHTSCSVVVITTDKVYENKEWIYSYRENDALGGYDPYSSSKAAADILTQSYRSAFFNPKDVESHKKGIAIARAGNVIGGGDWATDRIIPDIVRALSSNKEIKVRNPKSVRPWQHVLESLSGYLTLAHKLSEDPKRFADNFNFGPYPDDTVTVEELVKTALSIWGSGEYTFEKTEKAVHEAGLLKLENTKAVSLLGWKPRLNSVQAIEFTIQWYLNSASGVLTYTREQILRYSDQKPTL